MPIKIIRDPIHGNIILRDYDIDIVDSLPFQRLRHIKQLGFAYLVFPSAVHTRFEHSLGAMHLATKIAEKNNLSDDEIKILRLSALLHDIGHGPFSHTSEGLIETYCGKRHEEIAAELINGREISSILKKHDVEAETVSDIITGSDNTYLGSIITSELDADILDYLVRDCYYTGVALGKIDIEMLIDSISIIENRLVISHRAQYNAENFLVARYLMWPVAYLHKTECIADRMFVRAVSAALESGEISSERFYRFDDHETMSLFKSLQGYSGDIFKRLYRRQLFKSLWRGKTDTISRDMVNRLISLRKKPQRHIEFENYLADYFNIPHGYLLFDIQMAPSVDIRDSPRIIPEIYISEHGDIKRIDEISRLAESLSDAIWDHWFCALYTASEYRKILSDKIIDMPEIIEDGLP